MFAVKLAAASAMAGVSLVEAAGKNTMAMMHVYPSAAKVCFRVGAALKDGKLETFDSVGPLTYLSQVQYHEVDDAQTKVYLDLVAVASGKNACPTEKDEASLVGGVKQSEIFATKTNMFIAAINTKGALDVEVPRNLDNEKPVAVADNKWMGMFMNFGKGFKTVNGEATSGCLFKMGDFEVNKGQHAGEGDGMGTGAEDALTEDGVLGMVCDGTTYEMTLEKDHVATGAVTYFMLVGEKGKKDDYAPKVIWASAKKGVGSWAPDTDAPTSAPTKKPSTDARRRRTPTETDSAHGFGVAGLPLAAMGLAHFDL